MVVSSVAILDTLQYFYFVENSPRMQDLGALRGVQGGAMGVLGRVVSSVAILDTSVFIFC